MSANGANSLVRFGTFELDLRAGELRRNGARVRLQEQPLQVLAMLLERPGEVVTREELHGRLWTSDTFVDFDHGLNAAIKRLRDALGDSAENPRFVETLARRGYRFIAPVENSKQAVSAAPAVTPVPESRFGSRRWVPILMSAVGVLLVGMSAGWHAGRHSAAALRPMERRVTGNAPNDPVWSAAISPDGKLLAFSDKNGLFLRLLASGETQHVAVADDLRTGPIGWFPDGNRLLAVRGKWPSGPPGLWSLSMLGGSPRKLIDDSEEGAVSPDGSQIAFVRGDWEHQELWVMQSDGDQPRKIFGEKGGSYGSLAWSPDGKRIAFFEYANYFGKDQDDVSLAICDPASGHVEVLKENPSFVPGLNWTRGGRLVFALSEAPPNRADSNLWAQRMDARSYKPLGEAVRLTNGPDSKSRVTLSSNGKRLSYLRFVASPAVYVARVQRNGTLGTPERLSLAERRNFPYTWTPDGKSIIFISDRDGARHLYKQAVDQAAPDLLVGGDNNIMIARLDAEGTGILYLTTAPPNDPAQEMRLMRLPLSGGTPQLILRAPEISNFQCARMPSQTCILSQIGDNHIVFSTFDQATGKRTQIHSIDDPEWFLLNWTLSSDGRTLALAKKHRNPLPADILLLDLQGGKQRSLVLENWFSIGFLDFAADGKSIWVNAASPEGVQTLLNVSLHGKVSASLEEKEMELGWAIPSPNGRDVAIWLSAASSNAYLLEDF